MPDVLIIDDEENLCYSLQLTLRRNGHTCRVSHTGAAGLAECEKQLPDIVLLDIHLPDANGLDLIQRMGEHGLDVPVIVITAYGTVDSAVTAMKRGAFDYLQKPLVMEEVGLAVSRCLEDRAIRNQLDAYRHNQQRESSQLELVADCQKMKDVFALANRIASAFDDADPELPTVLFLGETGTGKEVLARYLHHRSRGARGPFIHVNCTAIPEQLFESELFGYEPGAFTNAAAMKKGLLEMANDGTLFLDEVGDMPLATQAKLLVAIERGRFRRLGSTVERVARVQVMAATNTDLQAKTDRGEFRADLFYRLKVFCLELPPLRERGQDVLRLAEQLLDRFCRKYRKQRMALSPEAAQFLVDAPWPGNIRELANVLRRAVLISDLPVISGRVLAIQPEGQLEAQSPLPSSGQALGDGDWKLSSIERRAIQTVLQQTSGNISEAARILGLTRGGLRHRIEKLGL